MNDRKIGYIVLILVFGIILTIIGYSVKVIFFPNRTCTVMFDRITNLQIDDPVKIKGADVGKIISIHQVTAQEENNIYVTFEVLEPFEIFSDYFIYSTDKGLMGDRVIYIIQGNDDKPVVSPDDTLRGNWTPSVSDALGSAWKLKDKLEVLLDGASVLLSGTAEKSSFISKFSNFTFTVDSFCYSMQNAVNKLKVELPVKLDSLNAFVATARIRSRKFSGTLPNHIQTLEEKVETIMKFIDKFEMQSSSLFTVMEKIKSNKLVQDDQITPLREQLKVIQNLLDEIKVGLVRFRAKIIIGNLQ